MLTFFCVNCGEKHYAEERHAGHAIRCNRCGRIIPIQLPKPPTPKPRTTLGPFAASSYPVSQTNLVAPSTRRRGDYTLPLVGVIVLVVLGLYLVASRQRTLGPQPGASLPGTHTPARAVVTPAALTPAEAKKREIIEQDAGRLGDLELGSEYQQIKQRYFDNRLPAIPVLWEPRLEEIGPLVAKDFTFEGLAALYNGRQFILLNPALREYPRQRQAALCHEAVHIYLFAMGDTKTNHGPAFQSVLRRLSEEGAFEGKWASESEKANLRVWLGRESAGSTEKRPSLTY